MPSKRSNRSIHGEGVHRAVRKSIKTTKYTKAGQLSQRAYGIRLGKDFLKRHEKRG